MVMKVVALIQARMDSKRFPGKVLADIAGHPMLWHVVHRVRQAKYLNEVVVATSVETSDDPIVSFCKKEGIAYFRGSQEDVLDRFYQAAKKHQADVVVRLTADCPLLDSCVIDQVVQTYLQGKWDYVSNILKYTYPDGLDTEVFSFSALEKAWAQAVKPTEREHVTPHIRNTREFSLHNVQNEIDLSKENLKWCVDTPGDLEWVQAIYRRLVPKDFACGWLTIFNLLKQDAALASLHPNSIRNEGYFKTLLNDPPILPQQRSLEQSFLLKKKAEALIPSLSQTFSKGPGQYVQGVAPLFLERAEGCHVWDVDGNEYIDYAMALGPVILGHCYPAVTEAVHQQLTKGTVFSLPHPLEIEVAELLTQLIPSAEMVRFGKNGSDVTAAAVRLARAYTGRGVIACCGYHGWQDWYIGTTTRNLGVPHATAELTHPFIYNDLASLEAIFEKYPKQVAAVILEPVSLQEPKDHFLQKVADRARKEGALLVFDEVLSGFRYDLKGAQSQFGVVPDLTCLGKAIANGYPLSAIVGHRELMLLFDKIFFSFTFGGETLSLAAAKATLTELKEKNVVSHLWSQGQRLKDGLNVLAKEMEMLSLIGCAGLPPRTVVQFKGPSDPDSLVYKSLFQQECLKRGILFSGSHNICYSHHPADIDRTLRVYLAALRVLREAVAAGDVSTRLEGKPVEPVFRKVN